MHIQPLGDRALLIELGGGIDHGTLTRVHDALARIDAARIPGITDLVTGYTSIAVHYEPLAARDPHGRQLPSARMRSALEEALRAEAAAAVPQPRECTLPVCYGGDCGPDLAHVAHARGLTPDEVVALHVGGTYAVHMIGFMPGFPYLGGLDRRLATPRRDVPRAAVPAGSVGIGGEQTGVYPLESPGGWHLIGRTPVRLFDAARAEPALLRAGDRVRFEPITAEEYMRHAAGDP